MAVALAAFLPAVGLAESKLPALFDHPPQAAVPATWWHWVDGNVSKDGITADLESMKKAGLSAAMIFSVSQRAPNGPVRFGTEEWFAMIDHALQEASRLDLEMGFHNNDGWSNSGGPWVPIEDSMKRLTWSETAVSGGGKIRLPQPETKEKFYRDVAVIAIPESPAAQNQLVAGKADMGPGGEKLLDGKWQGGIAMAWDASRKAHYYEMTFPAPVSVASMVAVFSFSPKRVAAARLEVADGDSWKEVSEIPVLYGAKSTFRISSGNFPPVEGTRFRLVLSGAASGETEETLTELVLSDAPRVPMFGHLGGQHEIFKYALPTADIPIAQWGPAGKGIPLESIIDLTDKMAADGTLVWDAPPGDWTVFRFGYTTTGATNHPATKEGTGWEIDKMDPEAASRHFDAYMGRIADLAEALPENPLKYCAIDSWEIGPQSWTARLPELFAGKTGYPLITWLPALAGRIVDSPVATTQFLHDYRQTISELIAENYEATLRRKANARGISLVREHYGQGNFSTMLSGYEANQSMDEFWTNFAVDEWMTVPKKVRSAITEAGPLGVAASFCYRATSAAHTAPPEPWRDPRVSAEAFTSQPVVDSWQLHPRALKRLGDAAFATGVNWFVMHCFTHQPYPQIEPGVTMGRWGLHFERSNTWFPLVDAWIDYLARCQALLQTGKDVREICVVSEKMVDVYAMPEDIGNYKFDWAAPGPVMAATVENGQLVLANGHRYDLLWVDSAEGMTPEMLQTLERLLKSGLTVVANKPVRSLSRRGQPQADATVTALADQLWGEGTPAASGERKIGDGLLLWGIGASKALAKINVPNGFAVAGVENARNTPIIFGQRRLPGRELYFVANRSNQPQQFVGHFRSGLPVASLWNPVDGTRHAVTPKQMADGRWELPLALDTCESVFVIFGEAAEPLTANSQSDGQAMLTLPGPWKVAFQSGRGAPEQIELKELTDLSEHPDDGVKFFSGIATYTTTFDCPEALALSGAALHFEQVEVMAEVTLNGTRLGTIWTFPNTLPCGPALKPGKNELVVRVANTWVNRMIGDAAHPDDAEWIPDPTHGMGQGGWLKAWPEWFKNGTPRRSERIAFATYKWWTAKDALMPSGLIGEVQLVPNRKTEPKESP